MRRLLRRLPSPALVIASLALFVALAGAGTAASLFLVRAPKPVMLVSGDVSASGKVTGPRLTGGRQSVGVYTLTIRGDTFAPSPLSKVHATAGPFTFTGHASRYSPAICNVASEDLAPNGSATAEVDCFTYDDVAGWQPTDVAFDFQMVGPSR